MQKHTIQIERSEPQSYPIAAKLVEGAANILFFTGLAALLYIGLAW